MLLPLLQNNLLASAATFDQDSFAFYLDDAGEAASTQTGTTNAQTTLSVDTDYQARILVQETAAAAGSVTPVWQYNHNAGGWVAISASSSVVKAVASANIVDGADTTQRIGAGSFDATNGWQSETGSAGSNAFAASAECEAVLSFRIIGADVANGDEVLLRLSGMTTYTRNADIDVSKTTTAVDAIGFGANF